MGYSNTPSSPPNASTTPCSPRQTPNIGTPIRTACFTSSGTPKSAGRPGPGVNATEAHNDQLQVLAETGVIGYAILIAAFVAFALTARGARRDPRESFARDAALPLAVSIFVSTLAQFPLQLAVTIVTYATAAGVLRGWTVDE